MHRAPRSYNTDTAWKVLLPCPADGSIWAIGCDSGTVSDLARSYRTVDIEPVEGTRYDAVVVGSLEEKRMDDFIPWIKPDGIFLDTCLQDSSTGFSAAGFKHKRQYAALPSGKPKLFIPLATRLARSRALKFHIPGSLKARMGLMLVRGLNSLGMHHHLSRRMIRLHARDERAFDKGGLLEWISRRLGYPFQDLVLYSGSGQTHTKITALAIAGKSGEDVVVRIADSETGLRAVKRESEALRAIHSSGLSRQAPRPLAEGWWNNYYLLAQEGRLTSANRQEGRLTERHLAFLKELSHLSPKILPFNETRLWKELKEWSESDRATDIPLPLGSILNRVLAGDTAGKSLALHRTHGDFAPWNIKIDNDRLFVYDWEESRSDGLALSDAFHFLFRQASLVGPWPGAAQMVLKLYGETEILCRPEGPTLADRGTYLQIWMLKEYMAGRSPHILEMCRQFGSRA
ncbi:MAG: phosphotransferase [Acidobacteria bacterium]|nr:phosphotransferase [Acidobacteriota bacterium]